MIAKSYPCQRHVPDTFNMEVPPPPPPQGMGSTSVFFFGREGEGGLRSFTRIFSPARQPWELAQRGWGNSCTFFSLQKKKVPLWPYINHRGLTIFEYIICVASVWKEEKKVRPENEAFWPEHSCRLPEYQVGLAPHITFFMCQNMATWTNPVHRLVYAYGDYPNSLNAMEWKSTLLGVILGITSFGVEIHSQNSGIHSKVVVWITLLRVNSTSLSVDFSLQTKWSLIIWFLKEWIFTPVHLERRFDHLKLIKGLRRLSS